MKKDQRLIRHHMDNCKVHNLKDASEEIQYSCFKRLPHLPYSPDIDSCGFFLYGDIKRRLAGKSFDSAESLIDEIQFQIKQFSYEMKSQVYKEWISRYRKIINAEGNYF